MKRNYFTRNKFIIGVPSILLILSVYLFINFDNNDYAPDFGEIIKR